MFARKTWTHGLQNIYQTLCWSVGLSTLNENTIQYAVLLWIIAISYLPTKTKMLVEFLQIVCETWFGGVRHRIRFQRFSSFEMET